VCACLRIVVRVGGVGDALAAVAELKAKRRNGVEGVVPLEGRTVNVRRLPDYDRPERVVVVDDRQAGDGAELSLVALVDRLGRVHLNLLACTRPSLPHQLTRMQKTICQQKIVGSYLRSVFE
jgi:hypothetical protein